MGYEADAGRAVVYLILSVLLLSGWLRYNQFIDYYLDVSVITNTRIVDVEQTGYSDALFPNLIYTKCKM